MVGAQARWSLARDTCHGVLDENRMDPVARSRFRAQPAGLPWSAPCLLSSPHLRWPWGATRVRLEIHFLLGKEA